MPPLTPRIKAYLDAHASQWVPLPLLHTLATGKGYSHVDITTALTEIEHTPPFAKWSVSDGDTKALKHDGITGRGVYYKKQPMSPEELRRNKEGLEAFDSL
jgi:hypothetical protein